MPYFSIIIAAYNRESLLAATLESIKAQTFRDYEVIVVDDGSTDGTAEVADQFDMPTILVRQENQGLGAARNAGAAAASGKYLAPLDSDDLWLPWTLATYHAAIKRFNEPSLLGCCYESFLEEREAEKIPAGTFQAEQFDDYFASCREHFNPAPSAAAIRADAYRRAGGFFEHRLWCEDLDMWMRLGDAPGFVIVNSPIALAKREHAGQMVSDIPKLTKGVFYLLDEAAAGQYPGGNARATDRQILLSQFCRALSMRAISFKEFRLAWRIYFRAFGMNLRQLRLRYLVAFPFLSLASLTQKTPRG